MCLDSRMFAGYERWESALLSTLFISTLPNILLFLIPSKWLTRGKNDALNIQHILLCFAAGALLGDVLLHSIPHLLSPHKHQHSDPLRQLTESHQEESEEHDHDHHHEDHDHDHEHHSEAHTTLDRHSEENHHEHNHDHMLQIGLLIVLGYLFFFISERLLSLQFQTNEIDKKKKDGKHSHHSHSHSPTAQITVMGWLNIFADVMHNFTDGIAMGASYASTNPSTSNALGLAATISILFHEIPHEIGDFTVLIESGVRSVEHLSHPISPHSNPSLPSPSLSKGQAIRMQFYTSIAAFLGTIVGLLTDGVGVWNEILLAVTSGGFIYVATSSLIPSVLNKTPENSPSAQYTQVTHFSFFSVLRLSSSVTRSCWSVLGSGSES
jgi:solute carrier family 39 (zinc transporter), member 7